MRKVSAFLGRLLSLIVGLLLAAASFVKLHFNPPRTWRLKGFIEFVAGSVSAIAYQAKSWAYAMYARWRIDRYGLA